MAPPSDEPPVGWRAGAPDYVGVGAQRSGTSWWNRLIVDHPSVVAPLVPANEPGARDTPKKELHYFDSFSDDELDDRDIALYHRFFPRPDGAIAGEWTPSYMLHPWIPPLLHRAAPRAKVLVLLRDPVERFRSGVGARTRRRDDWGLPELPSRRDAGGVVGERDRRRGLYWAQLRCLLEHFDRRQLLVLQYERCIESPLSELRRTYGFLEIDPEYVPEEARQVRPSAEKEELPAELRTELVTRLSGDVEELVRRFPDVDLALWPNFRHLAGGG